MLPPPSPWSGRVISQARLPKTMFAEAHVPKLKQGRGDRLYSSWEALYFKTNFYAHIAHMYSVLWEARSAFLLQ